MLQATVCDGSKLDAFAFCEDRLRSAEVDVSRREVVDALMIADVIVVLDEGGDLPFEIARQVIVVEQNAVLQGLVPALDLSLGLRVIRSAADMLHSLVFEPLCQIVSDVTRSIVAQKPGPLRDGDVVKAGGRERLFPVLATDLKRLSISASSVYVALLS